MKNSKRNRCVLLLGFLMVLPAVSMGNPPPPSNAAIPSYKVVSLNIRYDGGKDDPQELRWEKRKRVVARELQRMDPDLIGLQEVLHNQWTDLRKPFALGLLYGSVGKGRDPGPSTLGLDGEYNPIFYKRSRFELLASKTRWLAPGAPTSPKKAFGADLYRIFTYAKLRDRATDRVIWFINTHFSHNHDDAASERKVRQAEVLHHFISNHAREYGIWNASFYDAGALITTQDIAFPFPQAVIVTGDFNSRQRGDGDTRPMRVLTRPLVDDVGAPSLGYLGLFDGTFALNSPIYGDPRRVPLLANGTISSAHGTLDSAWLSFAPPATAVGNQALGFQINGSIDWILSNQAFTPIDYQQISKEHDAQGQPYTNENGDQVQLSDLHELVYAEFRINPDLSDIGEGIEIVAPRWGGKSYLAMPPLFYSYYFDEVVLNGLAR